MQQKENGDILLSPAFLLTLKDFDLLQTAVKSI